MNLSELYVMSFWGLLVIIFTCLIQWFVASGTKASQEKAIPGKIDPGLSHSSFVFRAYRTFMNSLENVPLMLGTAFLAILIGTNPYWTAMYIWIFAVARIIHMALYYAIATEVNPSPRSYFFMMGLIANVALLGLCGLSLAS